MQTKYLDTTIESINQEIASLQEKLNIAKKIHKELEQLPENKRLADLLHKKTCHHNHIDMCDYFYGNWDENPLRYGRQEFLNKANAILSSGVTFYQAEAVIKCM